MINENYIPNAGKNRSGWKKGEPHYETHRRKVRKEIEI